MAIPPLEADTGLLPFDAASMSWPATLSEVRARFVDSQESFEVRSRIWRAFEVWLDTIDRAGMPGKLLFGGSFVTGKLAPADIDVLVVFQAEDNQLAKVALDATIECWTLSDVTTAGPRTLKIGKLQPVAGLVDAYYTPASSPSLLQLRLRDWTTQFDKDSGIATDQRKGLIEVSR